MRPLWKAGYGFAVPLLLLCQQQPPGEQTLQTQSQNLGNKPQLARIHEIEKLNRGGMSELAAFSKDPDRAVRLAAIKAIVKMAGTESLDPLIPATHDTDAEVRTKATDGIVNVYVPGYVSGALTRSVRQVKGHFSPQNDDVIDPDVHVRDDAQQAITDEINFGNEMPPRANAALAAGILRLKGAVPAFLEAVRSKNNDVIFQSLVALEKIHDPSAGPSITFLVRDLDERIQITAVEAEGVLGCREAAPDIRYVVQNARTLKIRRAGVSALAMLAMPEDRPIFQQYAANGDAEVRTAAIEGLGRIREPEDTPTLQANYDEANVDWRVHLSAAFALVDEGNVSTDDFSPLPFLVENLNSPLRQPTAEAYLKELIRNQPVREAIVKLIPEASRDQKIDLSWIFASSHSPDMIPALNQLGSDPNAEVSIAAKRALSVIQQTH